MLSIGFNQYNYKFFFNLKKLVLEKNVVVNEGCCDDYYLAANIY